MERDLLTITCFSIKESVDGIFIGFNPQPIVLFPDYRIMLLVYITEPMRHRSRKIHYHS